jgi:hypothetical protein
MDGGATREYKENERSQPDGVVPIFLTSAELRRKVVSLAREELTATL